ncbi:hybrid sensor histidine kinase/response regulator [Lysobacter humi (ex Lee et al. 2017)]
MSGSENPLEDILNNATAALFILDAAHRCTYMNPAAEALTGYRMDEMRGRLLHDVVHHVRPDGTPFPMEACPIGEAVLAQRGTQGEEVFVHRDGRFYDVWFAASVIRDGDDVVGTVLEVHDISERKRQDAHRALLTELSDDLARGEALDAVFAKVAERLTRLLGVASCEFSEIDEAAGVLDIATGWRGEGRALHGRHRLDAIFFGDFPADLRRGEPVAVEDTARDQRVDAASYAGLGIHAFVIVPFLRDGAWRFSVSVTQAAPRTWREDEVRLLRGVAARVFPHIDRRRNEAALRESEERFRLMADAVPHLVWITRNDGTVEFLNRRWTDYTGLALDAAGDGPAVAEWIHPDDIPTTVAAFENARATGRALSIEHRMRSTDGTYRWFLVRGEPYRDPTSGEVVRWFGTSVDIHDVKTAQEALADADRRKDEFLAMLAHELRNPLAPIGTSAHLLDRVADEPARVREIARIIARQAGHMRDLVDDLLDVSRVTRGLITLRKEPLDAAAIVAGAVEQSRADLDARRHRLAVRLPDRPARLCGDRTRLIQVVANLLNNAAKYSPDGSRIDVDVECGDGLVRIAVADDGQGIEPALLPHVFELFSQGRRSPDRAHGGLGLGLALVHHLVQSHGGTVAAYSDGPGRGSRFVVELPEADVALPLPAPPEAPAAARRRRVTIVDDNIDAAEALGMVLDLHGHDVRVHRDARAALDAALHDPSDIYLLDIGLPGIDGYTLARTLRAGPAPGSLYVAITGYGSATDRAESRAAGFDHHLVKPVDVEALLAIVGGG